MKEKKQTNTKIFHDSDTGFSPREAIAEAKRCLKCVNPSCRKGCPIGNEIPQFIGALAGGNIGEASSIIARRSNLPAVCGRVCPHEKQCEASCILTRQNKGIHIGKLEQFIGDFDAEMGLNTPVIPKEIKGKVAVIGSGPAGLTIAGDLAKMGYQVVVYESQAEPGGVLIYGIPEFRLSKAVVRREIEKIRQLGVVFNTGVLVGEHITVDEIFAKGFDAIFIGSGTAVPKNLGAPGEELPGVFQATYFLRTVVLAKTGDLDRSEVPVNIGDRVAVIGAGNVAMDAARTALRMGASKVTVVYHRTENDMSALKSEYQAAVEEGVEFNWLASTTRVRGDKVVEALEYEAVEAGEDKKLTRTGQIFTLPVDKIMLAIGQRPAARIVSTTTGIDVNDKGYVITKERPYGMTTRRAVFAGGDVVHEPATVVLAMKEAKMVAQGIATYIEAVKLLQEC